MEEAWVGYLKFFVGMSRPMAATWCRAIADAPLDPWDHLAQIVGVDDHVVPSEQMRTDVIAGLVVRAGRTLVEEVVNGNFGATDGVSFLLEAERFFQECDSVAPARPDGRQRDALMAVLEFAEQYRRSLGEKGIVDRRDAVVQGLVEAFGALEAALVEGGLVKPAA